MKHRVLGLAVLLSVVAWAGVAGADETPKDEPGTHWVTPIVIRGRQTRPLAVASVARVAPAVKLAPLKQPLAQRIETATDRDPF